LLRAKVEITTELEKETLKVYLWNPGERPAYFDDLSIKKFSREPSGDMNQNE